jgi:hypothetical protein
MYLTIVMPTATPERSLKPEETTQSRLESFEAIGLKVLRYGVLRG